MSFKRIVTILALLTLSASTSPAFSATGKDTIHELVTLFSAWNGDGVNRSIFNEIAERIDYNQMSELAFTPAQWDKFSPGQKRELAQAFRQLIEERYYKRWHKMFLRSKLVVANEVKAGSDDYVKSYITGKNEDDTVVWRLRASSRNGEPKVVSLNVNGKDLLSRISPRLQKALAKRGPEGLISWMKDKADVNEEEETADTGNKSSVSETANHRQTASRR